MVNFAYSICFVSRFIWVQRCDYSLYFATGYFSIFCILLLTSLLFVSSTYNDTVSFNNQPLAVSLNNDVDTNKELVAHGYSNLLAGFIGTVYVFSRKCGDLQTED
jgi:hypothetical protein